MSNISVDYDVLNQRGSPAWFTDTFANIPTAGFVGRMFISKDTFAFYRDTGTGWDLIGGPGIGTLTGSGVVGQVSFFNGTQVLAGNNNLFWDNTNSRLGINTTTPGVALDIHSTANSLIQLNNTTTANSVIAFQNQSVTKWRIGNEYGSGANIFSIFNFTTTSTPFQISNTTNQITINGAVDLGTNSLTGNSFISMGNGASSGVIALKQNGTVFASTGYAYIGSQSAGKLSIYFGDTGLEAVILDNSLLTADRTYNFPNASGTLALTSDLSSYVPYTGATTSVNLGANNFTAGGFIQTGTNTSAQGGGLCMAIGNGTNTYGGQSNAISIYAPANSQLFFVYGNGTSNKLVCLVGNPTDGNQSYYNWPSALSGTLALTSDLSSYLPLTGGTLTGQLYINPANTGITGLDVASNNTSIRSDTTNGFPRQLLITMGSGTLVQLTAKGYGANYGTDLAFYTATTGGTNASPGIYITGTNNRVGIKTGTPAYDLDVSGTFGVSGATLFSNQIKTTFPGQSMLIDGGSTASVRLQLQNTSGNAGICVESSTGGDQFSGTSAYSMAIGTYTSKDFYIGTNSVPRLTIQAGGSVGIGTTNPQGLQASLFAVSGSGNTYNLVNIQDTVNQSGVSFIQFINSTAVLCGSITRVGTTNAVLYNTTSDYRLKEDLQEIKGLKKVLAIKVYDFKWKDNEYRMDGVLAHELQEIIPFAVSGKKDGEKMQGVDYSKIVPALIKSIQELNEKLIKNNIN